LSNQGDVSSGKIGVVTSEGIEAGFGRSDPFGKAPRNVRF